eukprot:491760-Prymnesium_polylepis.1
MLFGTYGVCDCFAGGESSELPGADRFGGVGRGGGPPFIDDRQSLLVLANLGAGSRLPRERSRCGRISRGRPAY